MRVVWLEIENFRSIKHLRLDGLDKPFVVIEGPNDVGKSNILRALDLAFSALPRLLREHAGQQQSIPGEPNGRPEWILDFSRLYRHGENEFKISLGIRFDEHEINVQSFNPRQSLNVTLNWTREGHHRLAILSHQSLPADVSAGMALRLAQSFRHIATKRSPEREYLRLGGSPWEQMARWSGSNLKQLLFLYKNSPELEVQERFEQLRTAVRDPALGIGIVNVSVQPDQTINVRTRQDGLELDLEERGSGVQQMLTMLALALCHRGRLLAIEEPEMNLSEPNQRLLWKKLREFAGGEGPLDQIFVTSHSRVFEEEAERLVVSRDPQSGTHARWAEPAPAKVQADEEVLTVTRGCSVTLPAEVLKHLGVQEGKHVYLVPTRHGYQLLGAQGYADHLREEGSNAESAG
ncbi:AAA family ATPase [Cystobacter fuscus]|uniref:AAA family ATPase n=1 Tax=Cystobacter fuscus TaxID=43 RepID=UPI0037C060E2